MRSSLAAVMLLQVLVGAPAQAQTSLGPPLPGPLPWRESRPAAEAAPAAPLRLLADAAEPAPAPLLAPARRRRLPPVVGHPLAGRDEGAGRFADFGQCVSEAERRAAAPSERFRAFRRNAVPIPPLLYLSQDRTFVEALFLYWSSTNVEERTKLRLLLPVFVWSCTPKNRTLVTPLFAHRDDAEGRAGFIGPYYYRRDQHAQSDVLFPLFSRVVDRERSTITALSFFHHRNPRGAHGGLVPLAFWGSYRDGSHYALAPPLFFHVSDRDQSTTVVPPFYYRSHRRTPDFDVGLAPLYFGARHGAEYADVVPPALFARWGDRRSTNVWWLTSYYHRRGADWSFNFVPFYFGGRSGSSYHQVVLPPLVAHWGDTRRARTMFLNLYVRVNKHDDDWLFFLIPAALGFRAGSTVAFVSPVATHVSTRSSATTIVPPFYLYRDEHTLHTAVMPLVFHGHRHGHRHDRRRGDSSYTHVPPLLFFDVRDRRGAMTWALSSYYRRGYRPDGTVDPADWDAGVFPLWFQGRDRHRRYLYVPPALVFDRENELTGARATIFPLGYRIRDRRSSSFGVIPFVFGYRSGEEHLWLSPVIWSAHWGDSVSSTTVVGPFFQRRAPGSVHRGVFPLLFQGRTGTLRYDYVLPLLFGRWQNQHERRLVVGPFYDRVTATSRDTQLVPFYFGGYDRTRASYYDVAFPFFARWGERDRHRTVLLNGYYSGGRDGYDVGVAPIFFHGRRTDGRHYTHVPPVVWHWGGEHEEGTVVLPFGFSYRHRDRYARAWTPLFYQWGDRRTSKSFLFPLAYFEREGASSLFLSPLVVSHIDAVEQKQRLVVFPLFWRFASRDSQVNVAFPVWWDFSLRRGSSRLTILFPLGFRYERRDETMTMFLNVAYTRGKGRFAGAWSFYFVPLLELSSFNPEHFKWQVLMGMLGRERQGKLARWRIAYFWTDPG